MIRNSLDIVQMFYAMRWHGPFNDFWTQNLDVQFIEETVERAIPVGLNVHPKYEFARIYNVRLNQNIHRPRRTYLVNRWKNGPTAEGDVHLRFLLPSAWRERVCMGLWNHLQRYTGSPWVFRTLWHAQAEGLEQVFGRWVYSGRYL